MDVRLDRIDIELMAALQNNARLSNKELAAHVGLAPSSCLERVRRLFREGVIRGTHAELDPGAAGVGLQALIAVRLARHGHDDVAAFRDDVCQLPEVTALYHVTGDDDFLIHVATRDAEHLRDLILNSFTTREVVARIRTSIIFEHVRVPSLPIFREPQPRR